MTTAYHSQNIFWVCDDMEGGVGCVEGRRVCLWLIHIVVGQKPTQLCETSILQLQKKNRFWTIPQEEFFLSPFPVSRRQLRMHRILDFVISFWFHVGRATCLRDRRRAPSQWFSTCGPGPAALALLQTRQSASSWSIPDLRNQKLWGQAQWSVFLGAIQVILIHNNTKVWELHYSKHDPAAPASPGSLLEMHNFVPCSRPIKSEFAR